MVYGNDDGMDVGDEENNGSNIGKTDGIIDGNDVGTEVNKTDIIKDGTNIGETEGIIDGNDDGMDVGDEENDDSKVGETDE